MVAALLHYLFLCAFCWMLAEGIMLYILVVKVFGKLATKWYYFLLLGWGEFMYVHCRESGNHILLPGLQFCKALTCCCYITATLINLMPMLRVLGLFCIRKSNIIYYVRGT